MPIWGASTCAGLCFLYLLIYYILGNNLFQWVENFKSVVYDVSTYIFRQKALPIVVFVCAFSALFPYCKDLGA